MKAFQMFQQDPMLRLYLFSLANIRQGYKQIITMKNTLDYYSMVLTIVIKCYSSRVNYYKKIMILLRPCMSFHMSQ
jgi:hypothetical protein